VFGEGPKGASLMLIGEQPGEQEDIQGRPFVGPAGRLLDECLALAGIIREEIYVTNAVKHFKWQLRGKRRLHARPTAREITACRPWLEAEIAVVNPRTIVCLGATAAQSLMGFAFRLTKHRGEFQKTKFAERLLATVHPSALLRIPTAIDRRLAREQFVDDLRLALQRTEE
jgi:uracil-DNA glycosylase